LVGVAAAVGLVALAVLLSVVSFYLTGRIDARAERHAAERRRNRGFVGGLVWATSGRWIARPLR
jgi:hypothetical protein